jgi:hypothetical protein
LSSEKLAGAAADECKALAQLTLSERNKEVEVLFIVISFFRWGLFLYSLFLSHTLVFFNTNI